MSAYDSDDFRVRPTEGPATPQGSEGPSGRAPSGGGWVATLSESVTTVAALSLCVSYPLCSQQRRRAISGIVRREKATGVFPPENEVAIFVTTAS